MTDDRRDQAEEGRSGVGESQFGGQRDKADRSRQSSQYSGGGGGAQAGASEGSELATREGRARGIPPMGRVFDPWRGFQSDVERIFENFFGVATSPFSMLSRPFTNYGENALVIPSVDVKESDNAIEITAELPGIKEDDIELTLRDGILTLRGEKRVEREDKADNYHMTERRFGSFQRSFRLPEQVNHEACEANYENGVLHIVLPKREGSTERSHRIKIGRRQ